jgi:hydroxypyruvate isomerase
MIKLSYNANGLRSVPVETAIREVGDAGYQAIELSLHPVHIDPFAFGTADADQITKALERSGVIACCLATGADTLLSDDRFEPSLIHPDEEGRERRIDLINRSLDIAALLGIPLINFATGLRKPEVYAEDAHRWLRDGLSRCIEYADGRVALAMEPEPGFFLERNDDVCALIAELGSPDFSLAQDLGHCRVVEDDYLDSVSRALPATSIIQVEDIKGRHHYHEVPGDGDIDFRSFFDVCRDGGYDGYYSVELYNHSDDFAGALKRSFAHLVEQADAAPAS